MKSYGPLHVLLGKMMRTDTVYMKTLESFSEFLVDFWLLWKSLFFFALVEFFFHFSFVKFFFIFAFVEFLLHLQMKKAFSMEIFLYA